MHRGNQPLAVYLPVGVVVLPMTVVRAIRPVVVVLLLPDTRGLGRRKDLDFGRSTLVNGDAIADQTDHCLENDLAAAQLGHRAGITAKGWNGGIDLECRVFGEDVHPTVPVFGIEAAPIACPQPFDLLYLHEFLNRIHIDLRWLMTVC